MISGNSYTIWALLQFHRHRWHARIFVASFTIMLIYIALRGGRSTFLTRLHHAARGSDAAPRRGRTTTRTSTSAPVVRVHGARVLHAA